MPFLFFLDIFSKIKSSNKNSNLNQGICFKCTDNPDQNPNIIIMDEPTNHLDIESIESLNSALSQYEGTLIFSSHDREFISSLATRIFELKEGEMLDHSNINDNFFNTINVN